MKKRKILTSTFKSETTFSNRPFMAHHNIFLHFRFVHAVKETFRIFAS